MKGCLEQRVFVDDPLAASGKSGTEVASGEDADTPRHDLERVIKIGNKARARLSFLTASVRLLECERS